MTHVAHSLQCCNHTVLMIHTYQGTARWTPHGVLQMEACQSTLWKVCPQPVTNFTFTAVIPT